MRPTIAALVVVALAACEFHANVQSKNIGMLPDTTSWQGVTRTGLDEWGVACYVNRESSHPTISCVKVCAPRGGTDGGYPRCPG